MIICNNMIIRNNNMKENLQEQNKQLPQMSHLIQNLSTVSSNNDLWMF